MDQNGRREHVELHANQSNHLGFRSKKSARKIGFQHVSEMSGLEHPLNTGLGFAQEGHALKIQIYCFHPLNLITESRFAKKNLRSSGLYARLADKISFSVDPNLRLTGVMMQSSDRKNYIYDCKAHSKSLAPFLFANGAREVSV